MCFLLHFFLSSRFRELYRSDKNPADRKIEQIPGDPAPSFPPSGGKGPRGWRRGRTTNPERPRSAGAWVLRAAALAHAHRRRREEGRAGRLFLSWRNFLSCFSAGDARVAKSTSLGKGEIMIACRPVLTEGRKL